MVTLLYVRLIGFTAGTLLVLFWMVILIGYRRQRNFERVLFLLCVSLFFFYSGSLLALNAQIYYARPPAALAAFAIVLIASSLALLPALLFHLQLEFAAVREIRIPRRTKLLSLALAYAVALYFLIFRIPAMAGTASFDFLIPGNSLGRSYLLWLFVLAAVSCAWEVRFARGITGRPEKEFHRLLWTILAVTLCLIVAIHFLPSVGRGAREILSTVLALLPLVPLSLLIYLVQRYDFLHIGKQRNLLYAVSATFVALLYLALVRRVSESLAALLPPEATAAILLFLLVIFIEPLQRALSRSLRETARREMDRVQRLMTEIQQQARQGNPEALARFIERRVRESFELHAARVCFAERGDDAESARGMVSDAGSGPRSPGKSPMLFSEGKISDPAPSPGAASLRAEPHGSALSGETRAALESLCEQLPAAIELCCAVEDKVRLERELAERERLAALGQMAASISHNLKNPLGSIKTILQVQLESPEMPDSLKSETRMVLSEISRLSNKLAQLLQFSRPALLGEANVSCDAAAAVKEVTEVLRREAEGKGICLQISGNGSLLVAAAKEAVSDILTNLIVNALEAAPANGRVGVALTQDQHRALIRVEDDGKGIPRDLREKVLQPFFTTKTHGTGLGLAIVAKRVAEACGSLEMESPIAGGRGTRFSIWLPLREEGK